MPALGLGLGIHTTISLSTFTTEYKAILTRAVALGYTLPSADVQAKQNKLIIDLQGAGTWNKLDVFYMYANKSASSLFGMINWKNPNASLSTITGNPILGNFGFYGAANSYIDTNYNPATNGVKYRTNSASAGIWKFLNSNTASKWMYGNSGSFNNTPGDNGGAVRIMTGNPTIGGVNTSVNITPTGLLIANKLNSTGINSMAFYSAGSYQLRDAVNQNMVSGNYAVFAYAPITGALPGTYLGGIGSFFAGESFNTDLSGSFDGAMTSYFNSITATNYLTDPTNLTTANWFKDSGVSFTHFASGGVGNQPYDNFTSSSYATGIRVLQEFTSQPRPIPNGTFSVYLKGTGSVRLGIYANGNTIPNPSITLTSTWTRYTVTRNDLTSSYLHPTIFFDGSSINCDICLSSFEITD